MSGDRVRYRRIELDRAGLCRGQRESHVHIVPVPDVVGDPHSVEPEILRTPDERYLPG